MTEEMVTQGQGVTTEFKERGLQAAFTINLKVFNGLNARYNNAWRYFHFDLNCGSGINEEVGCIGSPIAFINAAEQTGCQSYFAGFCDTNETALAKLLKTSPFKVILRVKWLYIFNHRINIFRYEHRI